MQYKNLGSQRQERVKKALADLEDCKSDPKTKGVYKSSLNVYAYELGQNDRIIFHIDYENEQIMLLRVGDHKMSYGKD
jgi:mRNA-degrading endonuclease RelE of RelBE toxin-antitoxin system